MEAEKSQDLPPVSRRLRKAGAVIWPWADGIGTRRWKAQAWGRRPHSKVRKREKSPSYCSVLSRASKAHVIPHGDRPPALFSLRMQRLISSRNTLTDTSRNTVLPGIWVSLPQSRWHIKLTTMIWQNITRVISGGCLGNGESFFYMLSNRS